MIKRVIISSLILFLSFNSIKAQLSDIENSINSSFALQQISVTIGGEFIVNGSFSASPNERLDQFVTRIYNTSRATLLSPLRDEKSVMSLIQKYDSFALRNIRLLHKDGEEQIIDLASFRLNGDFDDNPYLRDGDLIIFPSLDLETNFVSVDGAVNKPIVFQFVEGDDFQKALFFARGINKVYKSITNVTISRLSQNGEKESIVTVDIDSDVKLKSGDRITVNYDERNNHNYKVLILGEVLQPGYVPISKNSTTLIDVINKVGGFTENASLKFSEIIRNKNSLRSLQNLAMNRKINEGQFSQEIEQGYFDNSLEFLKMFRAANLEMRDTLYFGFDNRLRELNGYSHLDFRKLNDDDSFERNYKVKDGDVILIPEQKNEIYIWGGVRKIGYYPFKNNNSILDYVSDAGGFTDIAYGEDELYLIKGKSRDWILASNVKNDDIEPGDYIYVKKERPTEEFWFYVNRIGTFAGILGGLATIYLAFK